MEVQHGSDSAGIELNIEIMNVREPGDSQRRFTSVMSWAVGINTNNRMYSKYLIKDLLLHLAELVIEHVGIAAHSPHSLTTILAISTTATRTKTTSTSAEEHNECERITSICDRSCS